jgi:two-component system invasion response regulator UvrY
VNEVKILLVDDHAIVRAGFRSLIEDTPGMKVIGEADTGVNAIEQFKQLQPDLVILDLVMPRMGGAEALSKILSIDPNGRVIVLSYHDEPAYVKKILHGGALGYMTKHGEPESLLDAIRTVMRGERYVEPKLASQLLFGSSQDIDISDVLTDREFEVFLLLVQGLTVSEISEKLQLSPKTVGTHQTRIFQKCKTGNLASLTRLAIRYGFIEA